MQQPVYTVKVPFMTTVNELCYVSIWKLGIGVQALLSLTWNFPTTLCPHITHNFYAIVYDRIKSRVVLYHLRVCRFVNVLRNNRELTALSSSDSTPRWSKLVRRIRRLVRWWRDDTACTKCPLLPAMIWLTGSRVSSEYLIMYVIRLWGVYKSEHPTMHCFGISRHTQSMIAYMSWTNFGNSGQTLHCGNVVNTPYFGDVLKLCSLYYFGWLSSQDTHHHKHQAAPRWLHISFGF